MQLDPYEAERAAEVLELGQSLFDLALEAAQTPGANAPFPADLARDAASEFFARLHQLFGLEELTQ